MGQRSEAPSVLSRNTNIRALGLGYRQLVEKQATTFVRVLYELRIQIPYDESTKSYYYEV